ncbi:MAG: cytochrome c biogenesis protein CcsA [Candidatus Cryptobacteroides sp.]
MDFSTYFAFPLSLILAALLFVGILLYPRTCPRKHSLVTLALLALGFAILGCTKNADRHSFILAPLLILCIFLSGLSARDAIRSKARPSFIFTHLGLSILLASSLFSAPDLIDTAIILEKGQPQHLSEDGLAVPFELALEEVHTEFHEGTQLPRQYRGSILIDANSHSISVNHPILHKGWLIYLCDFDRQSGERALLRLVRDPSIPGVLVGMVLLILGAALSLKRSWRSPWLLAATFALAIVFTIVSVARIRFGTLPPALRSIWFAPHLIVYMLAYATLALSLAFSLLSFIPRFRKLDAWSRPLLHTSSSLILLGIIFGAIWAQLSWGDYWAWDAKECWAAATYLLSLCAIHLPKKSGRAAFITSLLLCFAAMQMSWWGVNYLPSSQDSMHTYNSK